MVRIACGRWVFLAAILASSSVMALTSEYCQELGLMGTASQRGVCMPAAGLGTGSVSDFVESSCGWFCNLTQQFYALGGRRTDSADSYGVEVGVGIAAKRSGLKREDMFFTSKVGPPHWNFPMGYNAVIKQADAILVNYSTSFIDLLLVHQPRPFSPALVGWPALDAVCDLQSKEYDERGCRISTWRGMLKIWRAGKARAVGVSNWKEQHLEEVVQAGLPLPAVNQVQHNPVQQQTQLHAYCIAHGIRLQAYESFGGSTTGSLLKHPKIQAVATSHNASTAQVILNWQWRHNVTSNPGFKPCPVGAQPCHLGPQPPLKYIEENLNFLDGLMLTDDDMAVIDALGKESNGAATERMLI